MKILLNAKTLINKLISYWLHMHWSSNLKVVLLWKTNCVSHRNEEVLVPTKETRSILKMLWHTNHRWLGHVLRHENFLNDIKVMWSHTRYEHWAPSLFQVSWQSVHRRLSHKPGGRLALLSTRPAKRFNLRQINMETRLQVRKHARNLLETAEDQRENNTLVSVSYTHLTLPTNREV